MNRQLASKIALLSYFMGDIGITPKFRQELDEQVIQAEYELIKQKKSKLSKSERDKVVYQYKKYFELIGTEPKEEKCG